MEHIGSTRDETELSALLARRQDDMLQVETHTVLAMVGGVDKDIQRGGFWEAPAILG